LSEDTKILLLDDDRNHLHELSRYLSTEGYTPLAALDPDIAEGLLEQNPKFAIVDLFLAGEQGAELSSQFILNFLVPRGIPYGRMSSAPDMVPETERGEWVVHKRDFWNDPDSLYPLLQQVL